MSEKITVKIPRKAGRLPKMPHKVIPNKKTYKRHPKHKGQE